MMKTSYGWPTFVPGTELRSTTPRVAESPPNVMGPLFAQFGRPSGWLGGIAGFIMSKGIDHDRWLVDLLDVQANDRVLEVGFGPGVATELIAARATEGLAAGVDPSEVMLEQAARRNWRAVQAHRVQLRQGTVGTAIPRQVFYQGARVALDLLLAVS